ncbi:Na+/H+ antiporter subunit D [bacterium]|nr:Na+/H+ antiporter subunit D [bacterium]
MNAVMGPYIFLIGASIACLVAWGRVRLQFWISCIGNIALLASALNLFRSVYQNGPQSIQLGNWPAPFGITFAVDLFSSMMLIVAAILSLVTLCFSVHSISEQHKRMGFYFLTNVMLLGVCAAFSTGDLFNLYVCFELLLLASFVLLSLGKTKQQLEASLKYVVINFLGSICFLMALALIYGTMGSLNMAHLSLIVQDAPIDGVELAAAFLLMVAFSIKASLFPLFSWLPASYHTPPTIVTAFFAGLLTKVGAYSLIKVFTLVFPLNKLPEIAWVLWVMAILTMVIGVLGAVSKFTMKKILSVHIISQVGYIILGLALFTPKAIGAAVFYMIHNIFAKTNLFLISGITERYLGTDDLSRTGGLFKLAPFLAFLFLISSLALAGIPPLSGFFAKLFIAQAAVDLEDWLSLLAIFGVSVLTLFSMIKIWNEAFWKKAEGPFREMAWKESVSWYSPVVLLATILLLMGVYSAELYDLCYEAGSQLFYPESYLRAVLGEPAP